MVPSSPPSASPSRATDPVSDADRRWLGRAVELGRRGWGQVHPNPMVGCVLVRPGPDADEGNLLAEGWHRAWGGPHAEVEALAAARAAGHEVRGATAYVSLEPCKHEGKTPPCTRALLSAGVARVVFGAADPGPRSGGGGEALARAGVEVVGPLTTPDRAHRENPAFFHAFGPAAWRPWVVLKLAVSADGHLAARPGERTPISGPEASARVQWLRAGVEGILVGGRTAAIDDPLLTVRGPVVPRIPPRRILLDPGSAVGAGARVFHEGAGEVVHLVGAESGTPGTDFSSAPDLTPAPDPTPASELSSAPDLTPTPSSTPTSTSTSTSASAPAPGTPLRRRHLLPLAAPAPDGLPRFDLTAVMKHLRSELGLTSLLCEGGGRLAAALLEAELVDRLVLVVSDREVGESGVPALPGLLPHPLAPGAPWVRGEGWVEVAAPERLGPDTWQGWDRVREEA